MASRFPIAVSYTDRTLTLIQLASRRRGFRVRAFAQRQLEPGVIEDGDVRNPDVLVEHIRGALNEGQPSSFSGNAAIFHLPENKTFMRVLDVPLDDEAPIAERVPWAIDEQIPLSLEKITYDWTVVASSDASAMIQAAAAPSETVATTVNLASGAGLIPVAIEPAALAFTRAVQSTSSADDTVFYMHLDAAQAMFVLYMSPVVAFTSSIALPYDKMVSSLAKTLSESEENVMTFLRNGAHVPWDEETILTALKPFLDRLAIEMGKVISYAETRADRQTDISGVAVTGALANLEGVLSYLSLKVGRSIQPVDVSASQQISASKGMDDVTVRAMAAPLGLAARDNSSSDSGTGKNLEFHPLNLLPRSTREDRATSRLRRVFMSSSIAIVAGTLLFLGYLFGLQSVLQTSFDDRLATQNTEMDVSNDQSLQETEQLVDRINTLAVRAQQISSSRMIWTNFLVELGEATPPNVQITSAHITAAPDGVEINGYAKERDDFLEFQTNLESLPMFSSVISPPSNLTVTEDVTFTITATFDLEQMKDYSSSSTDPSS